MQDFDQFLISTPEGLLVGSLYADQQLRVPLHEGEHRRASYALFVNWILRELSPERVGTVMSKISAVVPHYSDDQAAHGADADAPPEGGDLTDDFMMIDAPPEGAKPPRISPEVDDHAAMHQLATWRLPALQVTPQVVTARKEESFLVPHPRPEAGPQPEEIPQLRASADAVSSDASLASARRSTQSARRSSACASLASVDRPPSVRHRPSRREPQETPLDASTQQDAPRLRRNRMTRVSA